MWWDRKKTFLRTDKIKKYERCYRDKRIEWVKRTRGNAESLWRSVLEDERLL